MPRSYSLGKRAAQQAETRKRIVDAALAVYEEKGVTATMMQDVARGADVAPGTVANHFGSAMALASVATSQVLADLQMPTTEIFDGVEGIPARIRLLASELAAFFHRSKSWYRVAQREPGNPVWAEAEARYYVELDAMVRTALGPLETDADAVAVVSAVPDDLGHRGDPGGRPQHRDCGPPRVRPSGCVARDPRGRRFRLTVTLRFRRWRPV